MMEKVIIIGVIVSGFVINGLVIYTTIRQYRLYKWSNKIKNFLYSLRVCSINNEITVTKVNKNSIEFTSEEQININAIRMLFVKKFNKIPKTKKYGTTTIS